MGEVSISLFPFQETQSWIKYSLRCSLNDWKRCAFLFASQKSKNPQPVKTSHGLSNMVEIKSHIKEAPTLFVRRRIGPKRNQRFRLFQHPPACWAATLPTEVACLKYTAHYGVNCVGRLSHVQKHAPSPSSLFPCPACIFQPIHSFFMPKFHFCIVGELANRLVSLQETQCWIKHSLRCSSNDWKRCAIFLLHKKAKTRNLSKQVTGFLIWWR